MTWVLLLLAIWAVLFTLTILFLIGAHSKDDA